MMGIKVQLAISLCSDVVGAHMYDDDVVDLGVAGEEAWWKSVVDVTVPGTRDAVNLGRSAR